MFDETAPTLEAAAIHNTCVIRLTEVLLHAGTRIAVGADAGVVKCASSAEACPGACACIRRSAASLAASEDYVRLSVRAAKTPKALAEAPIMRRQTRSRRPSAPGWPLDGSASPAGFADRSEQRL